MKCSACGKQTQYEEKLNVPDDVLVIRADGTHADLEKHAKWCKKCEKAFCGECTLPRWQERKQREGLNGEQLVSKIESDEDDGHFEAPTCPECGSLCELQGPSKCFIATAACGSAAAFEVRQLQSFREECLRPYRFGRWIITAYEYCSPPVARTIARQPKLKKLVYAVIVRPMAAIARRCL
jgi:hypothetical protein